MSPLFRPIRGYTPPPAPPARSLEAVLKSGSQSSGRTSLSSGTVATAMGLVIGTYAAPLTGTDATKYANVYLPGAGYPMKIVKLKGSVDGSPGQPAYVLTTPTRWLVLGTVVT